MLDTLTKPDLRTERFDASEGRILLSGIDALVRIGLERKRLDREKGFNTAGFISGYRGSPLGGLDMRLQSEAERLDKHDIIFQPGINEDLAATAVWGTQQVGLYPGAKFQGVFGIWYGKTPGVDRSGDALKHANYAGTSPHGGVLAIAGDDHGCKSSSIPGQSEYNFVDAEIPVLAPSTIEEVLYFGVKAFDLSRYSGLWAAMTVVAELMDSTKNMVIEPDRFNVVIPDKSYDDVHIRLSDTPIDQEARLRQKRRPAAEDFAYHNDFDKFIFDTNEADLCIVTQGKAYRDVMQALQNLGIDKNGAKKLGIRLYKPGLVWPLEKRRATQAIQDVTEVLVIEERRSLVETQLREYVCDLRGADRPRIYGKRDRQDNQFVPDFGELNSDHITEIIFNFLPRHKRTPQMKMFVDHIKSTSKTSEDRHKRIPFFCPGCPHNSSTKVPEGSRATAGIGCHYLVQYMPRDTSTFTQMGGEGVSWVGQAPFTKEDHVFVNLGDGTYHHSGLLAIRQAVAAKVNVTYKILFNEAVAMTGGQVVDGPLTPPMIAAQLRAEGVKTAILVGDDVEAMRALGDYPSGTAFYDRSELDRIQKELREIEGVTAIIYVQTCATELRRKRKRGLAPDPVERIFINERVCEGCADCSLKSNCIAVETVETAYGQKRKIDQLACNKDKSCIDGFCPSFVTLEGATLKRPTPSPLPDRALPVPAKTDLGDEHVFEIVLAGVGGQGITSLSSMLSTAAHLEGYAVNAVDALGMAQKGGAVYTHFKMSKQPDKIVNARIGRGQADLILVNDMIIAHGSVIRPLASPEKTAVIANSKISASADVVGIQDFRYDKSGMRSDLQTSAKVYLEADTASSVMRQLGNTIFNNLALLGMSWQSGHLPLSREAIFKAIETIGTKVESNKAAFELGRHLAMENNDASEKTAKVQSAEDIIKSRRSDLIAYQSEAYAERFSNALAPLLRADKNLNGALSDISLAAAASLYKLMAYKDEYEVARLYASPEFLDNIKSQFEGDIKIRLHLAPPVFGRKNSQGEPIKTKFPAWVLKLFPLLAKMKVLRGSKLDIFGMTEERSMERRLRDEFVDLINLAAHALTKENQDTVLTLMKAPDMVKGYGHIKLQSIKGYERKISRLKQYLPLSNANKHVAEAAE
ncbi:indolepyruvate ferredoxin oxidoreductase family protein [Litorimonas sp.]|uniref:indolepyruvate ferredoxin oxidoreductase family protein n=1 Tax=Litorimonas sp. TaxID=1892381 RepID=UPI003A8A15F8